MDLRSQLNYGTGLPQSAYPAKTQEGWLLAQPPAYRSKACLPMFLLFDSLPKACLITCLEFSSQLALLGAHGSHCHLSPRCWLCVCM